MAARHIRVMLTQQGKPICLTRCNDDLPFEIPSSWVIAKYEQRSVFQWNSFPQFRLFPDPQNYHHKREWRNFLSYIKKHRMVAVVNTDYCSFYIVAPDGDRECTHCIVHLCMRNPVSASDYHKNRGWVHRHSINTVCSPNSYRDSSRIERDLRSKQTLSRRSPNPTSSLKEIVSVPENSRNSIECYTDNACEPLETIDIVDKELVSNINKNDMEMCIGTTQADSSEVIPISSTTYDRVDVMLDNFQHKRLMKTDPSYLRTLSQTHSAWAFGAISELIDNSRDAHATRLDISVELLYYRNDGIEIPVLSIIDDGDGMTHNEILRMLSFGHKQTNGEDLDRIGRFGIGFKTGAMKLGRDALVLTQSSSSRSVAFLSQSYNECKDNIEIPIVSYSKNGRYMELDLSIQSEECAKYNLSVIKNYSPFNEYLLGEQLGLFGKDRTGTQVFIWNLDKWGSDYTLEWVDGKGGESRGDIFIRSRRIRSRTGQISREVPLDYSLQAYLEVIFLNPRMKIFIQGSLVSSHPLEKSLCKTVTLKGSVMARPIQLILGWSQLECDRMNGGVFLYWNGRLIESYKRVGGMKHNADVGRGVIGVADVTDMMDNDKGQVWVLNSKQGFQDCEAYAKLEDWLGSKFNEYWDENFDNLNLVSNDGQYVPDNKWVQCDKCRKWRKLTAGFNMETLSSSEWFCYMPPFNGNCQTPEQTEVGFVTLNATRLQHGFEACQSKSVQSSGKVHAENGVGSHLNSSWSEVPEARYEESGSNKRRPTKVQNKFGKVNPTIRTANLNPNRRWNFKKERNIKIKRMWSQEHKESNYDRNIEEGRYHFHDE